MKILAIDPGPNTGFALFDIYASHLDAVDIWQETLDTNGTPFDNLWNILTTLRFDTLIYEPFQFRKDDQKRDKIDYRAAEYVGVIKLYLEQNPHVTGVSQPGSLINGNAFWADNGRVKKLGVWRVVYFPHGIDALRHLLYFLTFSFDAPGNWKLEILSQLKEQ